MSKIIIALCLLAIVFFVAAQEAAAVAPKNNLKEKLVQKIKDKVKDKIKQRGASFLKRQGANKPKLPLKERIANLKGKLAALETKRASRVKTTEQSDAAIFKKIGKIVKKVAPIVKKGFEIYGKVKGMGILADQASPKPRSRKPRSDKPRSRKPRSDKPRSRKPRSNKPAKTMSDAEFKKFFNKLKGIAGKVSGVIGKVSPILNQVAPKLGGKVDKIGGILGMFTQSDAEFLEKLSKLKEKVNKYKKFVPSELKEKLKAKIGDKLRSNPKFDKIRKTIGNNKELISKIADRLKKRKAAKTEADFFGAIAAVAGKALLKKAAGKVISKIGKKKAGKKSKSE